MDLLKLMERKVERLEDLVQRIKDALGTEEEGKALVEVARAAHAAEQELTALQMPVQE